MQGSVCWLNNCKPDLNTGKLQGRLCKKNSNKMMNGTMCQMLLLSTNKTQLSNISLTTILTENMPTTDIRNTVCFSNPQFKK